MEKQAENIFARVKVVEWVGDARRGYLRLLDQTKLPSEEAYLDCRDAESLWDAISRLVVRGAPAIGVAAAYGVVIGSQGVGDGDDFLADVEAVGDYLISARPTAINLEWAVRRVLSRGKRISGGFDEIREAMLAEASEIQAQDEAMCLAIGKNAAGLLAKCSGVLTHCNAGALATTGIGTATAGMYVAHASGAKFTVYCDETRPLLQGSRLTAWELMRAGIDTVVITDSMAGQMMKDQRVQAVIVGADRIAVNGDAANKIGTYSLAVLARHHGIPFYVAAPHSTFDLSLACGEDIPIEQRDGQEIISGFGKPTAPADVKTCNPAFDVTPAELITAIVTDRGIIKSVTEQNVRNSVES